MQSQLEETELRYKTEYSRIKSKLQNELDEIRLRYDSLKKVKSELENHLKKLQTTVKDAQDRLIEEQTTHAATRELLNASEKRFGKIFIFLKSLTKIFFFHSGLVRTEIEELHVLLDRVC